MGSTAPELLKDLGCTMQFEYVHLGLRFRARAGFTVQVYVIKKLQQPGLRNLRVICRTKTMQLWTWCRMTRLTDYQELLAFMSCLEPIVGLR